MLVATVLLVVASTEALRGPLGRMFPKRTLRAEAGGADDALFLTPYIQAGELEKARNLSRVINLAGCEDESYTGYITVDDKYNSNMFFWFFPAKESPTEAPVALWLDGGPGCSSMFSLFVQNGPFSVDDDLNLVPRNLSWTNTHSMLYIDNPVGTGFSFTDDDAGYVTNEEEVGVALHVALTQFFTLFESYQSNDFYIIGMSYAGKYVPAAAYQIHLENPTADLKINLKGMAIGDGLVDPINQLDFGDMLYGVGLIDAKQREHFLAVAEQAATFIQQGEYLQAYEPWQEMQIYFKNCTGFESHYNYLVPVSPYDAVPFDQYLNLSATRQAIHVGSRPFNNGQAVKYHLLADMMNSTKPMVASVLDGGYRVLIYNGQLDVIIPYTLTEQWLATFDWHGSQLYRDAERRIWRVDDEIAGYVREADNLHEVMVRNAGHILLADQPQWAYALINMFTAADGATWPK